MRVVHVIPQLALGGAEQVVLSLMREQKRRGVDAQLVVLGSQNAFPQRLAELPEPRFLHWKGKRRDALGFMRCVRRLRRELRKQRPDVVHSHLWPASRAAGWATWGTRLPHVVHVHDTRPWLAEDGRRGRLLRRWTRLSLRRGSTAYIAVSEAVREYTLKHLPGLTQTMGVCPNGIDPTPFADAMRRATEERRSSSDRDRLIVGTAGRFAPEKGHAYLIRAAAVLREKGVLITLRLAGDGPLRDDYERLIEELELKDAVELPGRLVDMPGFYASLDVFVLPSLNAEGMPITLLEAMAAGLPVVAADVAGVREVLRDGADGRLVPPSDAGAIVKAVADMAEDTHQRKCYGESASARVAERFSVESMSRGCQSVYDGLIGRPAPARTPDPGLKHG